MKLLLDTCVLSELRKSAVNPGFKELFDNTDAKDLFVSVVSLGELVKGMALLNEGKLRHELSSWINSLKAKFTEGMLQIDPETAHIWGEITAKAQKTGNTVSICDGLIAATALKHGLHLVTRNTVDFISTGVLIINPWK